MYTKVLVPFDGSDHAQHALSAALQLAAGDEHAVVTVLKVSPLMDFDDTSYEVAARMAGVPALDPEARAQARENFANASRDNVHKQIEEFFEKVPDNIDIRIEIRNGRPHDEIVRYAEDEGVQCIVMGRRGLGAIRAALGSVSSAVLRSTDLPVLVVK